MTERAFDRQLQIEIERAAEYIALAKAGDWHCPQAKDFIQAIAYEAIYHWVNVPKPELDPLMEPEE